MVKISEKKKTNIKSQLKEDIINSTCHGIPNIAGTDSLILKIIWTIFTLLSTGICAYLIIENIINYYQYEVTTKIRVKNEFNSTFPSITVCNHIHFTTKNSAEFINKTILDRNLIDITNINSYLSQKSFMLLKNLSEFKNLGDSLNKLLINSIYDLRILNSSEEFNYLFHPYFGNCYTFNAESYENGSYRIPKRIVKTGIASGLYMELNVSIYDELNQYFPGRAGVILIHEFDTSPLIANPIYIIPQYDTHLALTRTKSFQQPKPYSNCDEGTDDPNKYESEYFKSIHKTSNKYSQKLCYDLCLHRLMLSNCSCFLIPYTIASEGTPCLTDSQFDCASKFYYDFINSDSFTQICLPKCPLECHSVIHSITTSMYLKTVYSEKANNISGVRIYFEDFGITEIKEDPVIDVVILLSNIGGIAGLFLGVSVLSFIEIISSLTAVLVILIKKKKRSKRKNIQNNNEIISGKSSDA